MRVNAKELIAHLGLAPLSIEGGYYRETHISPYAFAPAGYDGPRALSTAIYYLLTPDTRSLLHRLRGDEVYHFYLGDPVELLLLHEGGTSELITLGQDLTRGMHVQHVVPARAWQGSRLRSGGAFALMGTTMSPGFDVRDFELGARAELTALYADRAAEIALLT